MTLSEFVGSKALRGDVQIRVDGTEVLLTHLDKLYWPKEGITKGDLLRYYAQVAPTILPYLRHRPLILKRYPNGIEAAFFFQHNLDHAPDYVRTQSLESAEERSIDYAVIDNTAALLYVTNLGTIEEHPWHSRVEAIDYPDWVVFDLDPEEAPFEIVCEVAQAVRQTLERLGLRAYAKTSGSRGIHVLVPIEPRYGYGQVADFAESVAVGVAHEHPKYATVVRSLSRRQAGLVYIDHLQNAKGKTIAAPYSVRARPGATVSAPVDWAEVRKGLTPQQFTLKNMPKRLRDRGDLFKGVLDHPQPLDDALARIQKQ
jgi:bifunctional non-homologous end joining protein LigD